MNLVVLVLVILFCDVRSSAAANILAIVPAPSYSHQIAFKALWKELSLRGHKVTLITTNPENDRTLTNLTEIDTSYIYEVLRNFNFAKVITDEYSMWTYRVYILDILWEISRTQLEDTRVQDLIYNKEVRFDVVMVHAYYSEYLAFGKIYNCPTILLNSFDTSPYFHNSMGNPSHPIVYHDYTSVFYGELNFKDRVISTLFNSFFLYFVQYVELSMKQKIITEYFPNVNETLNEIINDVDLLFINTNPALLGVRAVGPTTIDISGGRHVATTTKPLNQDLQEFLNNAKEGFIYFSLGSTVKSKNLKQHQLEIIIATFREIPFRVLWKFEEDYLPGKPDNVKLIKWVPQEHVLEHPNIKLFITQGGIQSIEEAVFHEVPMVVLPVFLDQERNSKMVKAKGIGKVVVHKPVMKKEDFKEAILEVANNSSYKKAIAKLHQLMEDWPTTGLERAVWWTEYVIRHKGAKHLRNPVADLPLYKYFLLDVFGSLVVVILAISTLSIFLLKKITKLFRKSVGSLRKWIIQQMRKKYD